MKKVFIDCGANIGQSVKAWYHSNPDAAEYEIYSFEASSRLMNKLKSNVDIYSNVSIINKAVWIHNLGVQFNDCGNESSSTEPDKKSGGSIKVDSPVFPSIDLSEFIKNNFSKEDKIILKIDIEGGEYHVIPHLVSTGALKYIDEIYLELHAAKLSTKTIQDDYDMINMIKSCDLEPMLWTADWTLKNTNYKTKERVLNKEYVIAMWKRKGRYKG